MADPSASADDRDRETRSEDRVPPPGRALVTGGAVRVGRAVALGLAEAGWDVAVHCHASVDRAEDAVERIRGTGRDGLVVRADLREAGAIPDLLDRAVDGLGGLDLLVNSAAAFPRAGPEEVTPEAWDEVFALNARAPFFCAVEARRRMGPGGGSVVNVADAAFDEAWPTHAPYAATKAALVSLTRSLAAAWGPEVRVNAVAPGPVLLPEDAGEEERRRAARGTALGRTGEPGDVADAVVWLAGADYVTGQVVRVDGGASVVPRTRDR